MTETFVSDTQFTQLFPDNKVPKHRIEKYHQWVESNIIYLKSCWEQSGEDLTSDLAHDAEANIRRVLSVPPRETWMSPEMAMATVAAEDPENATWDYFDALRTLSSVTAEEKQIIAAETLGVTPGHIAEHYVGIEEKGGRTALYRHYDDQGVLLYVGISNNPSGRFGQHKHSSRWAKLSARMVVEWYENKQAALHKEGEAIRVEKPVFNVSRSSREDRERAVEYLFDRLNL